MGFHFDGRHFGLEIKFLGDEFGLKEFFRRVFFFYDEILEFGNFMIGPDLSCGLEKNLSF
jgi:hypothetical protein